MRTHWNGLCQAHPQSTRSKFFQSKKTGTNNTATNWLGLSKIQKAPTAVGAFFLFGKAWLTEIPERPSVEDNQREQVPHFQMGYKSYIICTSPRSGSTLLCKLLTNTNVDGVPNSYFHKPSLTNWTEVHGIAPNCLANRSKTLEAVLKKAQKTDTAETGVFGLRLQGGSLNYFMDQLKLLHPELNSDVDRLNATFGETAFIFLSRKNKLEQAISCVKAMQTGLWHSTLALILQNSSRR